MFSRENMIAGRHVFCVSLALVSIFFSGCSPSSRFGDKMKVAGVFTSPRDAPRVAVIQTALRQAAREKDVVCDLTDSVPSAELGKVLRDYAEKGYAVIFGDAPDAEETVRQVARDYPEVAFCFSSILGPADPNLSVFNSWIYEPAYLCGLIAGRRTETNSVGLIAESPLPPTNALLNAFVLGVHEVNPEARVSIVFLGDRPGPSEAVRQAELLIRAGADHIFAGSPGAIKTCRENRVPVFGYLQDQYPLAPDTVITGPVWDLWSTVEKVITDVEEDRYRALDLREWSMMAKGGAHLAPYHSFENRIPFEIKDAIDQVRRDIMGGTFRVPANELPPDENLLINQQPPD
ncbi:MAG: BMP family protein [PVC group bacterium]